MDLPSFATQLLGSSETLLREWLPNGRLSNGEYKVGSLAGEEGDSLSINVHTGLWADFAQPDVRGGDLIALYAAIHGLGQYEAAKQLGYVGNGALVPITPIKTPIKTSVNPVQTRTESALEAIPADAPPIPGSPTAIYDYGLFRIARYEITNGTNTKTFKPWTWRNGKWTARAAPAPRALYGLPLNDRGCLIVEGEKCRDAAYQLLGQHFNCLTWAGGAQAVDKSDWSVLYGRNVDLWPDADEPGLKAMIRIGEILTPHLNGKRLRLLLQEGQPEGWDIADGLAVGWTIADVRMHIQREAGKYIKVISGSVAGLADLSTDANISKFHKGRIRDGKAPIVEAQPDDTPEAELSVHSWYERLQLKRDSGDRPYPTEANAIRILTGHSNFAGKLWLDEFAQRLMFEDKRANQETAISALIFIQESLALHKFNLQAIERAILLAGNANPRNPVKLWLDGLKWDGQVRLDELMGRAFGTRTDEYHAAIGRCWLMGLVARIYQPGCQVDTMPVFEGPQGIFKSSAMAALLPNKEWFMESHADPIHERKEWLQSIQGHWLIEIPELHSIAGRGSGIEKIKGIVSNRIDHYRVPYGRDVRPFPRQCVFAGTTNSAQWIQDPTGGRRFWPVTCGHIELDWIANNRDQLFAEAVALYKQDRPWHDVPTEAARNEQEARRETDPWEEPIMAYMGQRPHGSGIADVLQSCLQIELGRQSQNDQNRAARVLRANGYLRTRANVGNERKWVYRKSEAIVKSLQTERPDPELDF